MKKFNLSTWLLFLVPSILGILLFMIPVKCGEDWKVPIAKLQIYYQDNCTVMPWVATITLLLLHSVQSIYLFKKRIGENPSFMTNLFKVSLFWTIVRIIGAILAITRRTSNWSRSDLE